MNFRASFDAWDSVVDALAEELSAIPKSRREDLIAQLLARGGYETADPGPADHVRETRRALLHGLAERLSDASHRYARANAA